LFWLLCGDGANLAARTRTLAITNMLIIDSGQSGRVANAGEGNVDPVRVSA